MKKSLKIVLALILTPIVLLFIFNLLTMRSIKTDIIINTPSEDVWEILMNHETYPEWNPFIKKVSGSTLTGNSLAVTIQSEGNKPMDFKPRVLTNDKNKEFRWVGKLGIKGIFDGEHYFILEKVEPNKTRFTHGENFTGLLSGILLRLIKEDTHKGFISMNEALKRRAEKNKKTGLIE